MNRNVLTLLLALSPLAALAQSPAPAAEKPMAVPVATADARADVPPPTGPEAEAGNEATAGSEAVAKTAPDRHCLRGTGTRIKRRDRHGCTTGIGESYSGEELRSTGAATTAEALRMLSPRVGG